MLREVLRELRAPTTLSLLRELRNRTGSDAPDVFGRITNDVEGAIRNLKIFESELRKELLAEHDDVTVEGITNLPATLARFLAERAQHPGFRYDVVQDPVRGWIIRWKEYTPGGTVRGYGQIYERPFALLDE